MTVLIQTTLATVSDPLVEAAESSSLPLHSNGVCEVATRSVRFGSPEVVGYVTAVGDLTPKEKSKTWGSLAEMKTIISDVNALGKEAQSRTFITAAYEKAYANAVNLGYMCTP